MDVDDYNVRIICTQKGKFVDILCGYNYITPILNIYTIASLFDVQILGLPNPNGENIICVCVYDTFVRQLQCL